MSETLENFNPDGGVEREKQQEQLNNSSLALSTATPSSPALFYEIDQATKHLEAMYKLAETFIKGALCPLKKPEDVVIAILTGIQIGLPYTTSINNIYPINGKPAMSVHLMRALLLKNGIFFEKLCDFDPVFKYYEAEEVDGVLVTKKLDDVPILRGTATLNEIDQTKYKVGRQKVNDMTKYLFTRKLKQADGSFKELKVISSFSMLEGHTAGLLDKDNWKNYPARMCDARAFAVGAREIASDILFGMYSINELADASDIPYTISSAFEEQVIQDATIV